MASTKVVQVHNQIRVYSHVYKVRALYKKALRVIESKEQHRLKFRYHAVLLRKNFDDNKYMTDQKKVKALIEAADAKVEAMRDKKFQFPDCPGGLAEGREPYFPDWLVDVWHPMDKAEYAGYFARREIAKRDHIEWWSKTYGENK